jgi:gliding motility-associated-like protein
MVFHIYAADGVTELGTGVSTGDVPVGNVWHDYTANFTLPAGTGSVVIKLVSNASGTQGNDFAVDNITFRPYGSTVSVAYDQTTATTQTTCAGVPKTYTINSTSTLANGFVQKLQAYINGTWVDQSAASTATTYQITSPSAAGTYLYRIVSAITANISSANCVVASNQLTLNVTAAPVATFTSSAPTCLGDITTFTDATITNGAAITQWAWVFGDGGTSILQSPVHTYAAAGDYTVRLTLTNSNGCTSTTTNSVHINARPSASFLISTPDCETKAVTFTDNSAAGEGTLVKWAWDFGEGTTLTKTDNIAFTHPFTAAGTYPVSLTITSSTGCTKTTSVPVVIHPLPKVDFVTPAVCLSDASAIFTNASTIADNSEAQFTYLWNFGDASATALNPNTSTLKNPSHKYSAAANYTVTLTVTSKDGCTVVLSKPFTVNGANPTAALLTQNTAGVAKQSFCSGDAVVFNAGGSAVSFGNITKLEFYFDYDNAPTAVTTYLFSDGSIPTNKQFIHSYPAVTSLTPKSYHIRMVAYSGGVCASAPVDVNITINAVPIVDITGPATICQGDNPATFNVNEHGFTGTGVFTSDGKITPQGIFDPAASGPGKYMVTYTYTAPSGCSYTTQQEIDVNPNPKITASDVTVLEGGQTQITTVVGSGIQPLKYKWTLENGTSATGLDHDNIQTPIVTASANITYMVTVTSGEGCNASALVHVAVLKKLVIPNAFTPNGDGINDNWVIQYLDGYPGCSVSVFNRYGFKVYSSTGYPKPWDGNTTGGPLPVGTYYYLIDPKNGTRVVSGNVTIIR